MRRNNAPGHGSQRGASSLRASSLAGLTSDGDMLGVPGGGPPGAPGGPPSGGSDAGPSSDANDGPRRVLWGTYVGMEEAMTAFRTFLTEFKLKHRFQHDAKKRNGGIVPNDLHLTVDQEAAGERLLYEQ